MDKISKIINQIAITSSRNDKERILNLFRKGYSTSSPENKKEDFIKKR